jgi:hypothetical protein
MTYKRGSFCFVSRRRESFYLRVRMPSLVIADVLLCFVLTALVCLREVRECLLTRRIRVCRAAMLYGTLREASMRMP